MKKFIIFLLCVACLSVTAIAQTGVRIGNLEFTVRNTERDTVVQITVDDPCPPCPENETQPKPLYKSRVSDCFFGIGFILPDNSDNYYTVLGGNSINIDVGGERRYHLSRRLAVGGLTQYSFYNYRLRPVDHLLEEVTGMSVVKDDVRKHVFRSHNLAAGVFTRFYLSPPRASSGKGGMFMEVGAQGDFAFSKYSKLITHSSGKSKNRDGYAFNPFTASATARIGWSSTVIYARYRFTDAFNQKALPMDLPPITIGIQI
jgi:hypothetical protein